MRHEPPLITVPFILNMKEDIKYCVAAFRQLNNVSSFWGIPLEKVQQFSKTQHTKGFKEEVYFHAVKCSLPSVLSVIPLEEESLLDNFLEILKLCTMFKELNLVTVRAFSQWANQLSYVSKVVTKAEGRERQLAQGRSISSGAGELSRDGGKEAKEAWSKVKTALLAYEPFYAQSFSSRFVIMETKESLLPCLEALKNDEKHSKDYGRYGQREPPRAK